MDHYILVGKKVVPYEVETLEEMCMRDEQGQPMPCPKLMKIAEWAEDINNRIIQHTQIEHVFLSTVFLWMDHGFYMGTRKPKNYQPVVFETMAWNHETPEGIMQLSDESPAHIVFPEIDNFGLRHRSFDEAVAHHEECVKNAVLFYQLNHDFTPKVTILRAHEERRKDLGITSCPHIVCEHERMGQRETRQGC